MAAVTTLPAAFVANTVLTAAQMNSMRGAFRVLQVVQGTTSTAVNNSSNTYADTLLTATITPSSADSKVLCFVSHSGCFKASTNAGNKMNLRLVRGATTIYQLGNELGTTDTAINLLFSTSGVYLDSPATTSATTYKTQFMNANNTASVTVQVVSTPSTIVLMEISA